MKIQYILHNIRRTFTDLYICEQMNRCSSE